MSLKKQWNYFPSTYQNKDKIGNYYIDNLVRLKLFSYLRTEIYFYFQFQIIAVFFIIFKSEADFSFQNFSELNILTRILPKIIKKPFSIIRKGWFHLEDIHSSKRFKKSLFSVTIKNCRMLLLWQYVCNHTFSIIKLKVLWCAKLHT